MDLSQIRELLKIVADSEVAEVELEQDEFKLVVRKSAPVVMMQQPAMPMLPYPPMPMYPQQGYQQAPAPQAAPQPAPAPQAAPQQAPSNGAPAAAEAPDEKKAEKPAASGHTVKAPIVGTFYEAPAPDADPFVKVGDKVKVGDVLCIIEAMKLMNEIESDAAGTVVEVIAENGAPVEYDQPLFIIDPA